MCQLHHYIRKANAFDVLQLKPKEIRAALCEKCATLWYMSWILFMIVLLLPNAVSRSCTFEGSVTTSGSELPKYVHKECKGEGVTGD